MLVRDCKKLDHSTIPIVRSEARKTIFPLFDLSRLIDAIANSRDIYLSATAKNTTNFFYSFGATPFIEIVSLKDGYDSLFFVQNMHHKSAGNFFVL